MTPKRKQRLILVLLLLVGTGGTVALTLMALGENINHFYSPTQVASGVAPSQTTFRLGGMVVNGSVSRDPDSLVVSFDLTDTAKVINVKYNGILPDLFREGQGIVTTGSIKGGQFIAQKVLAKHDETYMPPEVNQAIKQANAGTYQSTISSD